MDFFFSLARVMLSWSILMYLQMMYGLTECKRFTSGTFMRFAIWVLEGYLEEEGTSMLSRIGTRVQGGRFSIFEIDRKRVYGVLHDAIN